jgi:hypothetical protein
MGAIMELTPYLFIPLYQNTFCFANFNVTVYHLRIGVLIVFSFVLTNCRLDSSWFYLHILWNIEKRIQHLKHE